MRPLILQCERCSRRRPFDHARLWVLLGCLTLNNVLDPGLELVVVMQIKGVEPGGSTPEAVKYMLFTLAWASLAATFSFSIAMVVWGRNGDGTLNF